MIAKMKQKRDDWRKWNKNETIEKNETITKAIEKMKNNNDGDWKMKQ